MKTLLTIFLSFCFSIPLFAEDLVLKNGKIYRDYEVIRKDKKGIKIRYTVHDGTLHYSRTKAIPYQDLKEKDQAKYQLFDVKYTITNSSEKVDVFLIPITAEKFEDFNIEVEELPTKALEHPEVAFIYILLLNSELIKAVKDDKKDYAKFVLNKINDFSFRTTLIKLCNYKKLNTTPVGEVREVPRGKYWFIALKKSALKKSGTPYYNFSADSVTINQIQTNIELEIGDVFLTMD